MVVLYIFGVVYTLIAVIAAFSASHTLDILVRDLPEIASAVTPFNRFFGCLIYGLLWPYFMLAPLVERAMGIR